MKVAISISARRTVLFVALCASAVALVTNAAITTAQDQEPIKALPQVPALDARKVTLGAKLFKDARLSKNNDVSCASCHDFVNAGGADPRARSFGTGGAEGGINSPTVLNSMLNVQQLWSGAEPSLQAVVTRVVKGPKLFATSYQDIIVKLQRDDQYSKLFQAAYNSPPTEESIIDAIVTFERSLVTPSRFDKYLNGDSQAITAIEKVGYEKFKTYGCVACHQGVNVGGNLYQRFGVLGDYFGDRGNLTAADAGRFAVTKLESDRGVFRVPSLRNVGLTAPYFHDASAPTLEAAIDVMFKYQLGRTAPSNDKVAIAAFLRSLSADPEQLRAIDALGR